MSMRPSLEKRRRYVSHKYTHLGVLSSGELVIEHINSHARENTRNLLPEAFTHIRSAGRDFFIEEVDFGRNIGRCACIETVSGDSIIYARRKGREGFTRFVVDREAESTPYMTVMGRKEKDHYALVTSFLGRKTEPEPWDPHATRESVRFWRTHAFVLGECERDIVPGTEMTEEVWERGNAARR